jgi:ankyrin repeat protein
MAACAGHVEAVCALGELGANVNSSHNKGATPVYAAALSGYVKAIRALCELGADVNIPEQDSCTPLF